MAEVTLFVIHPNERYCEQIIETLHEYDSSLYVEAIEDLREAPKRVLEEKPAAVIVGVDTASDPALKTIEAISGSGGSDVGIIVVSKQPSQELLVSCMRAGSDEFIEFPVRQEELAKTMNNLFRRKGIAAGGERKVIAVFSAAGGMGVTTVACNLAVGIGHALVGGRSCCIIDMNLQFGAVALALDIRQIRYTLVDAVREQERLDEDLLQTFMTDHPSGISVLPGPLSIADMEEMDPWRLRGVIQTCSETYQYVILDMPHVIDDSSIVGLDEADEIFLICDMVLPSIRNTIRALKTFGELGYEKEKLKFIVNRFYDSDEVSLEEIGEHVDLPLHWLVPYRSEPSITALNSGRPLLECAPKSPVTRSLQALARHTAGMKAYLKPTKKRGLFSRAR